LKDILVDLTGQPVETVIQVLFEIDMFSTHFVTAYFYD